MLDLSTSWTKKSVEPIQISRPPSYNMLLYETLWYYPDRGCVYAFGGEMLQEGNVRSTGHASETPEEFLWQLCAEDNSSSWSWTEVLGDNSRNFPTDIKRPIMGASAANGSTAYYIGGAVSKWTTKKIGSVSDLHSVPGILEFDFSSQTLTNSSNVGNYSAAKWTDSEHKMSFAGGMVFVLPFGTDGVFTLVGGQSNDTGVPQHWWKDITIFDPATGSWYSQEATGAIPNTSDIWVNDWSANTYCYFGAQDNELETFDM